MTISENLSKPYRYKGKGEWYKLNDQIEVTDHILLHMTQLIDNADAFCCDLVPINDDLKKALTLSWHVHNMKSPKITHNVSIIIVLRRREPTKLLMMGVLLK